jgi:hypothetical protein
MQNSTGVTRRGILAIAAGSSVARLYAFGSDFWNKKEPSEWSSEEVNQLTTKSPWAKEASGQGSVGQSVGRHAGMGGMGRGGGGGVPNGGWGGSGGGARSGGGGQPQQFRGTVRWESAKPILEATKAPLPAGFSEHYVISVSGLPLGRRGSQDEDAADALDSLKGETYLEPKGKRNLQPGIVQPLTSSYGSILFGFSKELLKITPDDKEVTFTTQVGKLSVKTKFVLKDMMYRGELAL